MNRLETKALRAWLDRHRDVMIAHENGATIQFLRANGEWSDVSGEPSWSKEIMSEMIEHKPGDLRVWWVPQVGAPIPQFLVTVASLEEGVCLLKALAQYDQFQFDNRIKGDYCNIGGLEIWVADSDGDGNPGWNSWYDEETDKEDPVEFLRNKKSPSFEDTDLDLHSDARRLRVMRDDGFEVFDDELGVARRVHLVTERGDPSVGIDSAAYWLLEKVGEIEPL